MKDCPFCAEKIQNEAIKCRFCGEFLNEGSVQQSETFKKSQKPNLSRAEVARYLCVPSATIDNWVRNEKMPFSRLDNGRVIFRKSHIDRWIGAGDVTTYFRYVNTHKKVTDILPEGYKPPSREQEVTDYIQEIHEKFIGKDARKRGIPEHEYARQLKKSSALSAITTRVEGIRVKFVWNTQRRKYVITEGKEAYDKYLKKDEVFQNSQVVLQTLMLILDTWY